MVANFTTPPLLHHTDHQHQPPLPPPPSSSSTPNDPAALWFSRSRHPHHVTDEDNIDDFWVAKAFAHDSNSLTGGSTWPPRSYSCTFCRREFRSAQALGGHMNVHRRDRARLRLSTPPPDSTTEGFSLLPTPVSPSDHVPREVCLLYPFPTPFTSTLSSTPVASFNGHSCRLFNERPGSVGLSADTRSRNSTSETPVLQLGCDCMMNKLQAAAVQRYQTTSTTASFIFAAPEHTIPKPEHTEGWSEGLDLELRLGLKP